MSLSSTLLWMLRFCPLPETAGRRSIHNVWCGLRWETRVLVTSASNYRRPRMDQVSATTHRFHSAHPRLPTHLQSLGSEHLDLTALTVAVVTMMHSEALGAARPPPAPPAGGALATGIDYEYGTVFIPPGVTCLSICSLLVIFRLHNPLSFCV